MTANQLNRLYGKLDDANDEVNEARLNRQMVSEGIDRQDKPGTGMFAGQVTLADLSSAIARVTAAEAAFAEAERAVQMAESELSGFGGDDRGIPAYPSRPMPSQVFGTRRAYAA